MFVMRPQGEVDHVLELSACGLSDSEIARVTGIPRETITCWTHGRNLIRDRTAPVFVKQPELWRPSAPATYSYLLGMYLGDGCVSDSRRSSFLRIVLDSRQQYIIHECMLAIQTVMPGIPVRRYKKPNDNTAILQASSRIWPAVFPQHGPGRKHERPIRLTDWQSDITSGFPEQLLRGLMHSDGCRTINRFSTKLRNGRTGHYAYVRYFFTNMSDDIRGIFCSLRQAWYPLESVKSQDHLGLGPSECREARRVHRPETLGPRRAHLQSNRHADVAEWHTREL